MRFCLTLRKPGLILAHETALIAENLILRFALRALSL